MRADRIIGTWPSRLGTQEAGLDESDRLGGPARSLIYAICDASAAFSRPAPWKRPGVGWLVARRRSPPGGGLRRANSGGPGTTGGACVPVLDYDIDRLQSEVSYRDNGTNLDSAPLPVPEPLTPGDAASTD